MSMLSDVKRLIAITPRGAPLIGHLDQNAFLKTQKARFRPEVKKAKRTRDIANSPLESDHCTRKIPKS